MDTILRSFALAGGIILTLVSTYLLVWKYVEGGGAGSTVAMPFAVMLILHGFGRTEKSHD